MATQIVAVIANNETSYKVVLERDGERVMMPRWSFMVMMAGTQRLDELFDKQKKWAGVMSDSEWQAVQQDFAQRTEDY
jgi:hypothetical protein